MAFNSVVDEMMEMYETSLKSSYSGYLNVHQQMQELMNSWLPGLGVLHAEPGSAVLPDWTKAFDEALIALQTFHTELIDEMQPGRIFKETIDDMWRQFGLARLDETSRLHDQVEQLKAQIAEGLKQDRMSMLAEQLEKNGKLVAKEDLKPFEKAFADLKDAMGSVGDVEALRLTVSQLENDMGKYMDEIAHIKELVAQINPGISKLTTVIDRLSGYSGKAKSRAVD